MSRHSSPGELLSQQRKPDLLSWVAEASAQQLGEEATEKQLQRNQQQQPQQQHQAYSFGGCEGPATPSGSENCGASVSGSELEYSILRAGSCFEGYGLPGGLCASSAASASSSSASSSFARTASSASALSSSLAFAQRESHECTTSDGWRLHITHVYDPTADAGPPLSQAAGAGRASASGSNSGSGGLAQRNYPVLLVPGLASSGEHTFDLLPEASLVNALAARGYDVWVADLRGNGRSQKPSLLNAGTWWTVDDHFAHDVPAVLGYVLRATGTKQVHWVGHSMGGMLAVGLVSQRHALAGALRSVTLLASGCFGRGSWHWLLSPLIRRVTQFGFPAGLVCQGIGALSGLGLGLGGPNGGALWPLEALFYWPANMRRRAARRLMGGCFRFIPVGVIRQFMGSLNGEQGLTSVDGSFRYADPAGLADATVPVMGLCGSWDLFCPASGGRRTVELFGSPHKRFVVFGPGHGTAKRHYGHFDIVSGRDAPAEVYPHLLSWLEQHDVVGSGGGDGGGVAAAVVAAAAPKASLAAPASGGGKQRADLPPVPPPPARRRVSSS